MSNEFMPRAEQRPDIAYYYPNPYWHDVDWAKNLILFFDGIAQLIPEYMQDHLNADDQAVIEGMKQHGLFHVLRPEQLVNLQVTEQLTSTMIKIVESGALDFLAKDGTAFGSISMSRLGYGGHYEMAEIVVEQLRARGLAGESEDGKSIPIHIGVRALILVLLAQILKDRGAALGFDFSPTTDQPRVVEALNELLSRPQLPTSGHVVSFDLREVGVDLGPVPIDEVLSFRAENRNDYRAYVLNIRKFVRELGQMDDKERTLAFEQRQAVLKEIESSIANKAKKAWRKPLSFCLGILGTGIGMFSGQPPAIVGGATRIAGSMIGGPGEDRAQLGAFSFLFKAARSFPMC
jgi:hypothetical protein